MSSNTSEWLERHYTDRGTRPDMSGCDTGDGTGDPETKFRPFLLWKVKGLWSACSPSYDTPADRCVVVGRRVYFPWPRTAGEGETPSTAFKKALPEPVPSAVHFFSVSPTDQKALEALSSAIAWSSDELFGASSQHVDGREEHGRLKYAMDVTEHWLHMIWQKQQDAVVTSPDSPRPVPIRPFDHPELNGLLANIALGNELIGKRWTEFNFPPLLEDPGTGVCDGWCRSAPGTEPCSSRSHGQLRRRSRHNRSVTPAVQRRCHGRSLRPWGSNTGGPVGRNHRRLRAARTGPFGSPDTIDRHVAVQLAGGAVRARSVSTSGAA